MDEGKIISLVDKLKYKNEIETEGRVEQKVYSIYIIIYIKKAYKIM